MSGGECTMKVNNEYIALHLAYSVFIGVDEYVWILHAQYLGLDLRRMVQTQVTN